MLRLPIAVFRHGSRCLSTTTGTVKFWYRKKQYGFLIPDGDEPEDIFCHRSDLISASTRGTPETIPFLMKKERVSFDIVTDNDKRVARNVTMENGAPVPMFRDVAVLTISENIKKDMGLQVYDILDDETMSEEDKVSKIMQAFKEAKANIDDLNKAKQLEEEEQNPTTDGSVSSTTTTGEDMETSTTTDGGDTTTTTTA